MKASSFPDEIVLNEVIKWMKTDKISFESAPFEAEWQLAKLEKDGKIDGIISTDGDNFILGAKNLYINTNFHNKTFDHLSREAVINTPPDDMISNRFKICFRNSVPPLAATTWIRFQVMNLLQSSLKLFLGILKLLIRQSI